MAARGSQLKLHRPLPKRGRTKPLWLGFAGGLLAGWFRGRVPEVRPEDLKRHDFPVSTQRMGVRFTERIRDTFRFRWIRKTS